MPVHLHIVFGCFGATMWEVSSFDRDRKVCKTNIFTVGPLRKCLFRTITDVENRLVVAQGEGGGGGIN